jgi:hypothetical protein
VTPRAREQAPRWIACRPGFFLPVRVLSRLFRGKLLDFLKQAYTRKQLNFGAAMATLSQPNRFYAMLRELRNREWVVYAKPPSADPSMC